MPLIDDPVPSQEGIEVDADRVWCAKHRTRLELDPKRVFSLASQRLFDFAVRDMRIITACGYNPMTGARGEARKIGDVLAAHSPLCCFLPGEQLERVYKECKYGAFEQAQIDMIRADKALADQFNSRRA